MIKFLHAADLHLDSSFHGLAPAEAVCRRQEQRNLLRQIAALSNHHQCDLVLLSGDLFDSNAVYPETVEAVSEALELFSGQVFIAPGNHDYFAQNTPYSQLKLPKNVHIFTDSAIDAVHLPHLSCTVYGAAFTTGAMPAMLENFHVSDESGTHIMVLHGDAENPRSDYNPITKLQITQSGLDYLALGHIHTCSGPLQYGKTTCAWPGCPMGRGFDETGEKGVILGEIDENHCEITFCPLPVRRYEILRVSAGDDALAAAENALPQDTAPHIYRIIFTGESAPLDLQKLHTALSPRFFSLQLRDETVPKQDIWQDAGADTLKGQFLALLQEKISSSTDEDAAILQQAARLGLAAMEGREEVLEW